MRVRPGAVAAVALGAALAVWLAVRSGTRAGALPPVAAVYWAGPVAGNRYDVALAERGWATLTYRPSGLRVLTYPFPHALRALRATARRYADVTVPLPRGGVAIYHPSRPDLVYVAYPGQPYQIEIVAPDPAAARRLVRAGAVRPLG